METKKQLQKRLRPNENRDLEEGRKKRRLRGQKTQKEENSGSKGCSGDSQAMQHDGEESKIIKRNRKNTEEVCLMCHQCQRNDKGAVVWCKKCKTKRYCTHCMKTWYPKMSANEVADECPVCLGNCNCKACLRDASKASRKKRMGGSNPSGMELESSSGPQDPATASMPMPSGFIPGVMTTPVRRSMQFLDASGNLYSKHFAEDPSCIVQYDPMNATHVSTVDHTSLYRLFEAMQTHWSANNFALTSEVASLRRRADSLQQQIDRQQQQAGPSRSSRPMSRQVEESDSDEDEDVEIDSSDADE